MQKRTRKVSNRGKKQIIFSYSGSKFFNDYFPALEINQDITTLCYVALESATYKIAQHTISNFNHLALHMCEQAVCDTYKINVTIMAEIV